MALDDVSKAMERCGVSEKLRDRLCRCYSEFLRPNDPARVVIPLVSEMWQNIEAAKASRALKAAKK